MMKAKKIVIIIYIIIISIQSSGLDASPYVISPPTHVRGVELEDGRIKLWWDLSETDGIEKYCIYAGKDKDSIDYTTPIATVPASVQFWISDTSTTTYVFSVSAMDRNGIESNPQKMYIKIPFLRISTDNCLTSYMDNRNNLWIGTPGGIKRINCTNNQIVRIYTVKDGLVNNYVQAIIQDKYGYMWFGTRDGVSCYTGKVWKTYTTDDGLVNNNVLCIMQDSNGCFWFGTPEGVTKFDGETWVSYTKADGLSGYAVKAIREDDTGAIWFATSDGITKFDGEKWIIYTKSVGLASNDILEIFKDRAGNLWFGSNYGGVSIYDGNRWFVYTNYEVSHTAVRSIVEDKKGNLWFATSENVVMFDGYNWETYTVADGLASYNVYSLSVDKTGKIWAVGTCILNQTTGISYYNGDIWIPWTVVTTGSEDIPVDTRDVLMMMKKHMLPAAGVIILLICISIVFLRAYGVKNISIIKLCTIFRNIIINPDAFFSTIYSLVREDYSILYQLSLLLRPKNLHMSLICKNYYHIQNAIATSKITELLEHNLLPETVEILKHGEYLKWGREFYSLYNFITIAYEAETSSQIFDTRPVLEDTLRLLRQEEFILPKVVDILSCIDKEFFEAVKKYQRARLLNKKIEHLTHAMNILTNLQDVTETQLQNPEKIFIFKVLSNWTLILKEYIEIVKWRAYLNVVLKNKSLFYPTDEAILIFEINNTGGGPAKNITVELLPGDGYSLVPGSKKEVKLLIPQRTTDVEIRFKPEQRDKITIELVVEFDDIEKRGKQLKLHEKINMFPVSSVIVTKEFHKLLPNPYVIERPLHVSEKNIFVGRDNLLRQIQHDLISADKNAGVAILYGQRKAGKTSILHYLAENMKDTCIPVWINLKNILEQDTGMFFYNIIKDIFDTLKAKDIQLKDEKFMLKRRSKKINQDIFRSEFQNKIDKVIGNRVIVLMFDRIEDIEKKIYQGGLSIDIPEYLRNMSQHSKKFRLVFSGMCKLEEMNLKYWLPMYDVTTNYYIGPLDIEDTKGLITKPIEDYFQYEPLAVEYIVKLTSGYPYLVQLLCHNIVEYRNENKKSLITLYDVNNVVNKIIVNEASMEFIWEELSLNQRIFLSWLNKISSIGEASTVNGIENFLMGYNVRLDIENIIEELMCKEIIKEDKGHYMFKIELLRHWIDYHKKDIYHLTSKAEKIYMGK